MRDDSPRAVRSEGKVQSGCVRHRLAGKNQAGKKLATKSSKSWWCEHSLKDTKKMRVDRCDNMMHCQGETNTGPVFS